MAPPLDPLCYAMLSHFSRVPPLYPVAPPLDPLCSAMLSHFSRVRLCATQRRQPTRLLCPWDSPGKNTGVGCHFLLQCMKVKSDSEVAQSCPTLSDPMDCSLPGSSAHGIFQARVLEWGAVAFSALIRYRVTFLAVAVSRGLWGEQHLDCFQWRQHHYCYYY